MESINRVSKKRKRKRKWKPVTLDSVEFFQGDMTGFVSLEVLEDDDLVYEAGGKVTKQDENDVGCELTVSEILTISNTFIVFIIG